MHRISARINVPGTRGFSFIQNGMRPQRAITNSRSPSRGSIRTMGIWSVGAIL